jgi:hypothetical protein
MSAIIAHLAGDRSSSAQQGLPGDLLALFRETCGKATPAVLEGTIVAEVLLQFSDPVVLDGETYLARVCGAEADGGLWEGWVEFTSATDGHVIRSARETTQPNRTDAVYWATGLTPVFLEGSLRRALKPRTRRKVATVPRPAFDRPAPDAIEPPRPGESILDPFSVYRKGEALLRRQLAALSEWHLVNIIQAYRLSDRPASELQALSGAELVAVIVEGVRQATARA